MAASQASDAAKAFGGIGAGFSVIGGVVGAFQASANNSRAAQARNQALEASRQKANMTNAYNLERFNAEVNDYIAARQYQYDTAVKQWQYDTEIQDYRYLQETKKYQGSVDNYQKQITFNDIGARMAYESQQAQFNELLASAAFEGEGALIEQLQAEGRASLRQAGGSRTKAIQSTLAEQGRNAAILSASLVSGEREYNRGMRDVSLQRYGADMQAAANLMIEPERLPELVRPTMGPARTFVAPMVVMPEAVPPAQKTNPLMPLISGVASGAMGLGGIL
jgi:hypothetical protein